MSQIHKQTIYKAISEPIFAKDIFSRLPISDFKEDGYDMVVSTLNMYYRTNDNPLEEQVLLTLIEDKMLKQNKSLEEQQAAFNLVSDLYKLDEAETDSEAISESIQNYVRKTLTREAIMDAVTNEGTLGSDKNIQSLLDSLREIMTIDSGGHGAELLDFFNDVDKKKEYLRNLQQNKYPTGFLAIDAISDGGLARGEVGMVIAPTGGGKSLKNGTKIKTPSGDVPIENLKVNDLVYGLDGKPHKVTGVFPQGMKDEYEVTFSDGVVINCNDEHIWAYQTNASWVSCDVNWQEATLREIIDTIPIKDGDVDNIHIPICNPVEYSNHDLSLHPYLLGILLGGCELGDSEVYVTSSNSRVIETLQNSLDLYGTNFYLLPEKGNCFGYTEETKELLLKLNLFGENKLNKCIPEDYLYSSIDQRLELLRGLIDSNANVVDGKYSINTLERQVALDTISLVQSLGGVATLETKKLYPEILDSNNNKCKEFYMLTIEANNVIPKLHTTSSFDDLLTYSDRPTRTIRSIKKLDSQAEMTCISIDSTDKLYLTEGYVVTHNTTWAVNQARNYVVSGLNVLYVPLEEKVDRMIVRFEQLLSQQSKKKILVDGELNESLYSQIQQAYEVGKEQLNWGNLWIRKYKPQELTPNGLSQLISDVMIRKGEQIDVVIIDYPDLMKNPHSNNGGGESDSGGKLFEDIRAIAQEYDFVCWTLSQLNRSSYGQEIKNAGTIEGSKRKMNAVELIFTLNQTPEEFQNGFIRAYVDKLRNNSGVAYDKMLYFKVLADTMTIRDETAEEHTEHLALLAQTSENLGGAYKKENNFTPKDVKNKINDINSKLVGGLL